MSLAVFDLDGTLADTLRVDHRCFIDAFQIEHGIDFTDGDWATYHHTTDSGIAPEVIERHFGRPARAEEVERHKRRFVALLDRFDLPLASADDAEARGEIVAHGVALAAERGPFNGTLLIGDKPWDLAAARQYGFGFIGVGSGRQRLEQLGASRVFDDWRETGAVLAAFEEQAARGSV